MASLADRLKKSALNFDELKTENPEVVKKSVAKISDNSDKVKLTPLIDDSEIADLKRQLKEKEDKLKALESEKGLKLSRYEDFRPRTFRITDEQYNSLRDMALSVPKSTKKYERITVNTFLRAVLQNVLESKEMINTEHLVDEWSTYKEVSKIFKDKE